MQTIKRHSSRGFTLIELLTVIAIIGILAGILIPTVGAARTSANKSKTKAQFGQWAVALGLFKSEYGFYPKLAGASSSGKINTGSFLANLTARNASGTKLSGTSLEGNVKGLSFYSVSENDLLKVGDTYYLVDAFRNAEIVVMVDANGDGLISGSERVTDKLKGGNPSPDDGETPAVASGSVDSSDIRAGVAFYSAGKNSSVNDYVYSWK